jgi:hypothetical protein
MTYNTTMNNAKHDNRVNRVQRDDLQHNNAKHNNEQCKCQEVLTARGAGLSAEVGELEGLDGSTTMPVLDGVEGSTTVLVLDGVEGSTTVVVLDGVEGMTYKTGKSTTKSTMMHKSTTILSNLSMCELGLKHLRIDLRIFTLITHLPQPSFQSSYCHQKRIHWNRGRRRSRWDAGENRRRAPRHCRCTSSSHGFGSTKGKSSIGMAGLDFGGEH